MILWFLKILRLFFAFLDRIAYTLIALVYQLFMLISEAGIFSQATIQEFATRIYVLLGLIMVFKVSTSLVSYILNPDSLNDKQIGAPALLKGFAFALVGIVLVPYVFEAAYSLQRIVLKDNLIGNLIMGMDSNNNNSDNYIKNAGKNISFVTLTAFIRLDTQFSDISEACAANPVTITEEATDTTRGTGTINTATCGSEDKIKNLIGQDGIDLLTDAYANRDISVLTDGDLINITVKTDTKDDEFVINYLPGVSTAAGLFIAYVLLLFCIDIAVRSVKLGFLQLIAPIPLIAKIDPKKGAKAFENWASECVSTYFDVFLRLAAIYFVLFILSAITTSGTGGIYNVTTGAKFDGVSGVFVTIFIIIGSLQFAKDLPKLLESLLGGVIKFKGMGGFTLNASKKLGATPLIGGTLAAGAGLAGRTGANLGKGLFTAAGKGLGALDKKGLNIGGAMSKLGNKMKDIEAPDWAKKAGNNINKVTGNAMSNIGSDFATTGGQIAGSIQDSLGLLDSKERKLASEEAAILQKQSDIKNNIAKRKQVADAISAMENRATEKIKSGDGGILSDKYRGFAADLESAKHSGDSAKISAAQAELDKFLNDDASKEYINNVMSGNIDDDTLKKGLYEDYKASLAAYDTNELPISEGGALHKQSSRFKTSNSDDSRKMISDNQRLDEIKEEKRSISEMKRTNSSFSGGKK